ncbi:MAG: metalloregulator ArsR/SmtB family transcription factor [Methanosarcina sp.]|jgi:ArsR family transcriptional regulator|uniref:ArsR/SmtB family transcription factor n=1 Tax=Methanosarcina sp. TaxID=2213 RepID=UPI002601BAE9|nr:metalloregulator ArsR/SmtB family transcription factor [Methanosarcina sp.]MDD3248385.1 metalloregulator ArsR/SmtB family transcription factor [Methanosarcina sp.]MDD4249812.1 metalloregulator ArsR/SmtB family transcription factor [Methanosarcina sp.]
MINEENLKIFKALSEETRYKIIKVLLEGEKCACEIPDLIGRTQSNTSMHLAKLQDWDIIKVRKDGKMRLYSIDNEKVRKLLKLLEE